MKNKIIKNKNKIALFSAWLVYTIIFFTHNIFILHQPLPRWVLLTPWGQSECSCTRMSGFLCELVFLLLSSFGKDTKNNRNKCGYGQKTRRNKRKKLTERAVKTLRGCYKTSQSVLTNYFQGLEIYFQGLIIYFQSLKIYFHALKIII